MTAPNPHCRIGRIRGRGKLSMFPGVRLIDSAVDRQPDAATVKMLRETLEEAERGIINGFAAVTMNPDGSVSTQWAGGGKLWSTQVAGGIVVLLVEYITAVMERRRQAPPPPA